MKMSDRIWLKLNRNPPGRMRSYAALTVPWVFIGIIFSLMLLSLEIILETHRPLYLILLPLGLLVVYIVIIVLIDSKWGYIDAIYQHNLKRWQNHREKLGVKNEEESR